MTKPLSELLSISDDEVLEVAGLMGLPREAFCGALGNDPRLGAIKSMGRIDVAACPGSGKTTLLVGKLAVLARKWKFRTSGICVLSHTNAARYEIEQKLGKSPIARTILSYPHFVGTIHSFANEFLAIPWLRSNGIRIELVDTEIAQERRWHKIAHRFRAGLEQRHYGLSKLEIVDRHQNVGGIPGVGANTDTHRAVLASCRESITAGYHCYGEMFIWANALLDDRPDVARTLRERFRFVLIDEAQDNQDIQSQLLRRVFLDGDRPSIYQRFGDSNQAIYDRIETDEPTVDPFPMDAIKMDLPSSHRFGQTIADIANPFGLSPCGLQGRGPKQPLAAGTLHGRHTIFLFNESTIKTVLEEYGKLLLATFSDKELADGTFVAIGQVHNPSEDTKIPRHVGHYWSEYSSEAAKREPKPRTFEKFVVLGHVKAARAKQTHEAVEAVATAILRLAHIANPAIEAWGRRYQHRHILQILESATETKAKYLALVDTCAVSRRIPSKAEWLATWRTNVVQIAQEIAGRTVLGDSVDQFLIWSDDAAVATAAIWKADSSNLFLYPLAEPKVRIRVGSIHSVKGETHAAVLLLETFWNNHNLESLLPWLLGDKSGSDGAAKRIVNRLKIHYVGLTRPTHLVCLALKRSTIAAADGSMDHERVTKLRGRGWAIVDLCN